MKRTCLFGLVILGGLWPVVIHAESIFDRHDRRAAYLFVDNRGRRVGDLLTVIVRETTDIDQKEKRALDKKSDTSTNLNFTSAWQDGAASHGASGSFTGEVSSDRSFDGAANFSSQRDMADQMTVTIVDVLPNGNVRIEGVRDRIVSGEKRTLLVSGIVRPCDVSVTNIVESRFIANFRMTYVGRGVDSRFVNQGWMSRAVNKIWPF
jgi:flagellar L-ring protein precursor FlgH